MLSSPDSSIRVYVYRTDVGPDIAWKPVRPLGPYTLAQLKERLDRQIVDLESPASVNRSAQPVPLRQLLGDLEGSTSIVLEPQRILEPPAATGSGHAEFQDPKDEVFEYSLIGDSHQTADLEPIQAAKTERLGPPKIPRVLPDEVLVCLLLLVLLVVHQAPTTQVISSFMDGALRGAVEPLSEALHDSVDGVMAHVRTARSHIYPTPSNPRPRPWVVPPTLIGPMDVGSTEIFDSR